jgi:translation initiation factor 1A
MPSSKPKGGKKVRRGKNITQDDSKILTASIDQYYGKVTQLLGNSRVYCDVFIPKNDNIEEHIKTGQLGVIRGGIRKRTWVNNGSIILVSLREFEKGDKVDILYAYNNEQVGKLKHRHLLPCSNLFETNESDIQFEKNDSDENEVEPDIFNEKVVKETQSYSSNFNLIPDTEINYDSLDEEIDNL